MSGFVRVRIGLWFPSSLFLLLLLLLLCLAGGFLSLLPRILLRLEQALLLLRLLELGVSLSIFLLLFKLLLCSCGSFSAEILHLLFFLCHLDLSLLFFNDCLHLSLLHQANIRHHRTMAHRRSHVMAPIHWCTSYCREV